MINSLLTLISDAYQRLGWRLPLLAAMTFISAALEGATLVALLPLIAPELGPAAEGNLSSTAQFLSRLPLALGLPATARGHAAVLAMLLVIGVIIFLLQAHLATKLQAEYVAYWQRRLVSSYFQSDYRFLRGRRIGDLISIALAEPVRLGTAFYQANLIVTSALFVAVQVSLALLVAPMAAMLLLALGAFLFACSRGLVAGALRHGQDINNINADLQTDAGELLGNAKLIKATATEPRAIEMLFSSIERLRSVTFANAFEVQLVRALFEYASGAAIILLLAFGPTSLGIEAATIFVVVAMFVRLFPKITGLRQTLQAIGLTLPSLYAITAMVADAERHREVVAAAGHVERNREAPASIQLKGVSVSEGGTEILRSVDLDIRGGSIAVLVGPSGAGKTTLVDCILGLRQPDSGVVCVDHQPLSSASMSEWRKRIGYLGQDPILFNRSIGENLRWTKADASLEEMSAALKSAAADFVSRLPQNFDTVVGDRGSRLSGGERQRLALARALLGRPRLLVLDEGTSALDAATEEQVVQALSSLRGHVTIVAITHRPALLAIAEKVIRLEAGQIV